MCDSNDCTDPGEKISDFFILVNKQNRELIVPILFLNFTGLD
jgi:hypothetical protein